MLKECLSALFAATLTLGAAEAEKKITSGGVEMVKIAGGTFNMGDAKGKSDAQTVHEVKVSDFYMDAHEVTQEEYMRLMEYNPAKFRGEGLPVERVRWIDAAAYCNARSTEEGLTPVYDIKNDTANLSADGYRLPTEAEWEYAARAGGDDRFSFGSDEKMLTEYGWIRNNSEETTHKVKSLKANSLGLYDLYGNVAEWCHDIYGAKYYAESQEENPSGPTEGKRRVIRGGSWADRAKSFGSAVRSSDNPVTGDICQGYDTYGFRCVRPVKSADESVVK